MKKSAEMTWDYLTVRFERKQCKVVVSISLDSCEYETMSFSFVQVRVMILSWNNGGFKMSLAVNFRRCLSIVYITLEVWKLWDWP